MIQLNYNLQYKMFLLNDVDDEFDEIFDLKFTIQNVSIKFTL